MGTQPNDAQLWLFDQATEMQDVGDGRFRGSVAEGWEAAEVANGGYVAALATTAMERAVPHHRPILVSTLYARPARTGPLDLEVLVVRAGRRHTSVEVVLQQGDEAIARVRGLLAGSSRPDEIGYVGRRPPQLPDPEDCVRPLPGARSAWSVGAIATKVELRIPDDHLGFARGTPSGTAAIEGWVRHADGRPADLCSLPLFSDCFPPSAFNLGIQDGWVPTVELDVHLLRTPSPGWLRARFETSHVSYGYLTEDGEIWDADDHLVAVSRQLALGRMAT